MTTKNKMGSSNTVLQALARGESNVAICGLQEGANASLYAYLPRWISPCANFSQQVSSIFCLSLVLLGLSLKLDLLDRMPRSTSSSGRGRGRGRGKPNARGSSARPQSTTSRSSRSHSINTRAASHWQNGTNQRRVTINPRPSIEPSSASRSVTPAPPSDAQSHSDRTEELLDHVIVAIDVMEKGTVGCAYYRAREERLLCMEDVPRGGVESIERCNNESLSDLWTS